MAKCDVCGNDYDKSFRVTQGDRTMTFDSFECAIHAMAPRCPHCECRVIGHGTESKGKIYCCAHCAKKAGVTGVDDRADWGRAMIRKLKSGQYLLYSRKINPKTGKRRNLGTFPTRAKAEKHERAVQYFKRHG
jgi:nitrite reductase/ring-hydroxylating ferredoxin subunit